MKKFTLIKLVKKILTIVWRLICFIRLKFLGSKSKSYFSIPQFSIGDATVLKVLLNRLPPQNKNIKILEVGSWMGNGSTIILGEFAKERDGMLYCVDTWRGSLVEKSHNTSIQSHDIYGTFEYNIQGRGLEKYVKPLIMPSSEACEILRDNYFDFIFIDGDHTYEIVKQDILNFSKKLRSDGILCGHDCSGLMDDFEPSIINENLTSGTFKNSQYPRGILPGVIKAVSEVFGSNNSLTIWTKIDLRTEQGELLSTVSTERGKINDDSFVMPLGLEETSSIWSVTLEGDVQL